MKSYTDRIKAKIQEI